MVDLATCFKFFAGVEDARFDLWLDFLAAPGFGVEFGFVADLASLFVHVVDVAETCFFGFDEFCEEHQEDGAFQCFFLVLFDWHFFGCLMCFLLLIRA